MRNDLLDSQACVEWANSQLHTLEGRITAWRDSTPYKIVEELYPQFGEKWYKFQDVIDLPPIVNAEAGFILNALRSALDILANSLAKRNGHADPKHTQFPICRSRADFLHGKHAGRKEVSLLSGRDRAIIEKLEPWDGGHPCLFDLHTLDNIRKHRNLIGVYLNPRGFHASPDSRVQGFQIAAVWGGFENDSVVGWAPIDQPKPDFQIPLYVMLSEGCPFPSDDLLGVLNKFTSAIASIIAFFG